MSVSGLVSRWLVLPTLAVLPACGVSYDPASEVQTLRVLAVKKDAPYPAPGATVNFEMLWHDGSEEGPTPERAGRPVQVVWLPPCFNPPGGVYYSCGDQLLENSTAIQADGSRAAVTIPASIIDDAGDPVPGQPRFGQTFVFFAVCAGELGPAQVVEEGELPFACFDEQGESLGPDDFVAGYTTLYTFDGGFENQNPVMNPEFRVAGQTVTAEVCSDTTEGACIPVAGELEPAEVNCDVDEPPAVCVRACEDDGDPECPEIDVKPSIDEANPANSERDAVARASFGRDVGEQMWVNYYVTRGGVKSEVRLLNDATVGWNEDYGTKFFAPEEPGPVTLWAAAHDNRGGVAWTRIRLQVY